MGAMQRVNKAGEGTYGIVYIAQDDKGDEYAIKRNLIDQSVSFAGSLKELDLLYRVKEHPFIVKLLSVSYGNPFASVLSPPRESTYKDDMIHFIFEKASFDCHELIYARNPPCQLLKYIFVQMLLAVEYLHAKGIIHRDIKPSNFLYFKESASMKICDFGLSKFTTTQGYQTPRVVTAWYRAPEIVTSRPDYTVKSDIWSLGCVFFELLAKTAFLVDVNEHDTEIFNTILQRLPIVPSEETIKKLCEGSQVRFSPRAMPSKRKSWREAVGFASEGEFDADGLGTYAEFLDLLSHMLDVDPTTRYSAGQCLAHSFFSKFRAYIEHTRDEFPLEAAPSPLLAVYACKERTWAAELANHFYQSRYRCGWYTHRILFQSIDMFDRYLEWAQHNLPKKDEETALNGVFHSRYDAQLRYLVCLYISLKYFTTMYAPINFAKLAPSPYNRAEAIATAGQFETQLVRDIFRFSIYRETVYESADAYDHHLNEAEIEKLLLVYTKMNSYSGLTAKRLFKIFRFAVL